MPRLPSLWTLHMCRANSIKNKPKVNTIQSVEELRRQLELANITLYQQSTSLTSLQRIITHFSAVAESMLQRLHPTEVKQIAGMHPVQCGLHVLPSSPSLAFALRV